MSSHISELLYTVKQHLHARNKIAFESTFALPYDPESSYFSYLDRLCESHGSRDPFAVMRLLYGILRDKR